MAKILWQHSKYEYKIHKQLSSLTLSICIIHQYYFFFHCILFQGLSTVTGLLLISVKVFSVTMTTYPWSANTDAGVFCNSRKTFSLSNIITYRVLKQKILAMEDQRWKNWFLNMIANNNKRHGDGSDNHKVQWNETSITRFFKEKVLYLILNTIDAIYQLNSREKIKICCKVKHLKHWLIFIL